MSRLIWIYIVCRCICFGLHAEKVKSSPINKKKSYNRIGLPSKREPENFSLECFLSQMYPCAVQGSEN